MKIVRRLRRRRDGLHLPETIHAEIDTLKQIVDSGSPNRRIQLMAYGAKVALEWAVDNRNDMKVSRMLDLTKFALKMEHKAPVKLVPRIKPR